MAYHEAGHAVIGLKLESADNVEKVTIIPRGEAGGYNMMIPGEEKMFPTKAGFHGADYRFNGWSCCGRSYI